MIEIDTLLIQRRPEKVHTKSTRPTAQRRSSQKTERPNGFLKEPVEGAEARSTALLPRSAESLEDYDDRTLMFGKDTQRAIADQQTRLRTSSGEGTKLTRVGAIMGTPLYMSPEQCAGNHWMRGRISTVRRYPYQMLAGETPFADLPAT